MIEVLAGEWVQRVAFVLGGLATGYLLDRILSRWLCKAVALTATGWDDAVANSLKGLPTAWLGAAGLYVALGIGDVGPALFQAGTKVVTVVLIGTAVLAAIRIAGGAVERISTGPSGTLPSSSLIVKLARGAVAIIGLFIILQNLGIEIAPLLTALGIGGLAVALALQDTLSNLFAGVQIIMSRQVRPSDYVRLSSGEEGFVADVKARNTTITTFPDNNLVVVPNAILASSIVKNYSMPRKALWVSTHVGVSYASDLEKVERVTLEVAREVLAELEPKAGGDEPLLRFHTFGDSSIDFEVRMQVSRFVNQGLAVHEFVKRLHARYGRESIDIPFPIRTLQVPQGLRVRSDHAAQD